ncbi:MAG: NAD-dependent epimerase/dehydratase family protein [Pseudomonadota bacterium]
MGSENTLKNPENFTSHPELSALENQNIAITGACGFLGFHLTRLLLQIGARVIALTPHKNPPRLNTLVDHPGLTIQNFDLSNTAAVGKIIKEYEPRIVFHLAAYGVQARDRDSRKAIKINVAGSAAVVSAAAACKVERFVQIGTSHEYGESTEPLKENAQLHPTGLYGATKAAAMLIGQSLAAQHGLHWVGLRPFVTYGPFEDTDKFIPYVITQALCKKPIVTSSCEQVRDFTFVEDLVVGVAMSAAQRLESGTILNLGSGQGHSLAHIIKTLTVFFPNADLRIGSLLQRSDEMMYQVANTQHQQQLLRWRPIVSLEQGLKKTVQWYANQEQSLCTNQ